MVTVEAGAGPGPLDTPERALAIIDACRAMGFGMAVVGTDGSIIDADERVCEILRMTLDELRALPDLAHSIAPGERYRVSDRRRARRAGPVAPLLLETTLLAGDATLVPVECAVVEVGRSGDAEPHTGDGPVEGVVLILLIRDVTTQAESLRLVDRYERLVERMPVAVLLWDANHVDDPLQIRLVSANQAASDAFGFDVDACAGRTVWEIFPQSHRFDDAARTLAMRGTGRVEYFPDLIIGNRDSPRAVYHRRAVDLTEGVIAHVMEDVTSERVGNLGRRRLLERLVDTGDEERRAIAMGVHDDPVQQIAAATLLVEALQRHPDSPQRDERLRTVESALRTAMSSLRRLVFELSPPELVESGLVGALHSASAYLFGETDTTVTIESSLEIRPEVAVQTAAFRIAAEALTNIRKHARATLVRVEIGTERTAGPGMAPLDVHSEPSQRAWAQTVLVVTVADNGGGFVESARPGHLGLRSMRERATALGGDCVVRTGANGTTVVARIPLEGRAAATDASINRLVNVVGDTDGVVAALRLERDSLRDAHFTAIQRADAAERQAAHMMRLAAVLADGRLTMDELVGAAAPEMAAALGDGCVIRLLSADGQTLQRVASWHPDPVQLRYLDSYTFADRDLTPGYTATALTTLTPLLVDGSRVLRISPTPTEPGSQRPHSGVVAPILIDGRAIGTVSIARDVTPTPFTGADVGTVQQLTDCLAIAISRSWSG